MDRNTLEFQQESEKLAEVIEIAQNNLDKAKKDIRQMDEDIAELYATIDMDEKEGLILWNDATIRARQMKREFDRFEKARKKPYFGRIDFADSAEKKQESYYIGRVGIFKTPSEPVVIDWRAPIASIYYENNLGKCQYTVSSEGTFEVDLKKKRTYNVERDQLVDFFDSDVVANDDLLTSYLAKNKKAVLGEIIATIQKEQNLIIRRSPMTNMIVQGCAGSGKTTVAMHRISYILYNYEDSFRPEDFYIIGSNKILLNYITSVLPDLDVYGIRQMTMEELFIRLLYEDWDKHLYQVRPLDKSDEENCIKGTNDWFLDLQRFCERYERRMISREEVRMDKSEKLLVGRNLIDTYCKEHASLSMQSKINMLNEILFSKYENEIQGKGITYTAAEKRSMERKFSTHFGMDEWKGSIFELYHLFLQEQAATNKYIWKEEDHPKHPVSDIVDPKAKREAFDVYDLAALAYIYKRIKETDAVREASHVVIDEAQDFGMMAYQCLHFCMRDCTYTIMGDTSQNIHFGYGLNDWEELRSLILTGTYDAFGLLKKSYRNTIEISHFATDILRHGDFPIYPVEPIVRHGDEVCIKDCKSTQGMIAETVNRVIEWKKNGYDTIAIVCRDDVEAKALYEKLKDKLEVADGTSPDAEFGNGTMVLPVAYTKGLEFDAVLLYNPSEENYPSEDQYVKLLYVAATRALHECVVLHDGNLSKLIATKAPEGKHQKELSAQTLTKALEYERVTYTEQELQMQLKREGAKDMHERTDIGPARIVVSKTVESKEYTIPKKAKASEEQKVIFRSTKENSIKPRNNQEQEPALNQTNSSSVKNSSPYIFGDLPDTGSLRPKGHSKSDFSIKWVKKEKQGVELVSAAGSLQIQVIDNAMVRVLFTRMGGMCTQSKDLNYPVPKEGVKWNLKEMRDAVELMTDKLIVRVEKKNGAVSFLKADKTRLLSEKLVEPRQLEKNECYIYFDWDKKESIKAKGILKDDFKGLVGKAMYISHGGKSMRMPLIQSQKGYELTFPCDYTVMCCDIPMYGPYVYCDHMDHVDYYFSLV